MRTLAQGAGLVLASVPGYISPMTKTATYDLETQTFTLRGTGWHDTYPISDLPRWLAFYRKMHKDFPKSNGVYLEWVAALEGLTEERGAAASPPRGATTSAD